MISPESNIKPMTAKDNKFLKVRDGVVLTPVIEPVIIALDKYFERANCIAWVTSGLRDAEKQLKIIKDELIRRKMGATYIDAISKGLNDKVDHNGESIYAWQLGWSALLKAGFIVSPPISAVCLMDYISGGVNKKGKLLNASIHISGLAFNVGGGPDGISGSVTNELAIMQKAVDDKLKGLKNILAERNNNAIHANCYKI